MSEETPTRKDPRRKKPTLEEACARIEQLEQALEKLTEKLESHEEERLHFHHKISFLELQLNQLRTQPPPFTPAPPMPPPITSPPPGFGDPGFGGPGFGDPSPPPFGQPSIPPGEMPNSPPFGWPGF